MAIYYRAMGRCIAIALGVLTLQVLMGVVTRWHHFINPILTFTVVGDLLYALYLEHRRTQELSLQVAGWNESVRRKMVDDLTVIMGHMAMIESDKLPEELAPHRHAAMEAARRLRDEMHLLEFRKKRMTPRPPSEPAP